VPKQGLRERFHLPKGRAFEFAAWLRVWCQHPSSCPVLHEQDTPAYNKISLSTRGALVLSALEEFGLPYNRWTTKFSLLYFHRTIRINQEKKPKLHGTFFILGEAIFAKHGCNVSGL
jgi:hypothetical protein